jgi:hypothetical protein
VTITSQIQKVRILVELVEDGSGAVLDIGRGEYGDGVLRESFGKLDASVVVFLRRDTGRDYHSSTRSLPPTWKVVTAPSPALSRCGCVSCSGWPNLSSAADTECSCLFPLAAPRHRALQANWRNLEEQEEQEDMWSERRMTESLDLSPLGR